MLTPGKFLAHSVFSFNCQLIRFDQGSGNSGHKIRTCAHLLQAGGGGGGSGRGLSYMCGPKRYGFLALLV